MDLNRKFSVAHYDNCVQPFQFYDALKHSPQTFKNEIFDIYFGKIFRFEYREQETYDNFSKSHEVVYGNVTGVEATDEQIAYLFRIQDEFGIPISLTINQLNVPVEFFYSKNHRVMNAFLAWLKSFYDRGLRSCTLANNHLMRTGILQREFPEMVWKNTVNQQLSSAQQVIDYLYLGYNIIQLDRSLNRNMDELKRIKVAVDKFKAKNPGRYIKTSMLARESCIPACPFKREHDDLQIYHHKVDYRKSQMGALSCSRWHEKIGNTRIPRFGSNCFWLTTDTFQQYAGLVDVLQLGGTLDNRIYEKGNNGSARFSWSTSKHAAGSFSEIIDNRLEPLYGWGLSSGIFTHLETEIPAIKADLLQNDFWTTDKAKQLEQKLKTCRNQCSDCHMCEDAFGIPAFESMVEF